MSSALLIACCQIAYALLPSLLHDRGSPLTSHRHATHLAPLLVMRSRRPPAGMYTSCVLFRCPTPPPEVTFFPADVAERMGCDASLPFLIFLGGVRLLLPLSRLLWDLVPRIPPSWAMVCPMLLRSFLLLTSLAHLLVGSANVEKSVLHTSSFHDQFPHHIAVRFRPFFDGFLVNNAWIGSSQTPSISPSHSCSAALFFQDVFLAFCSSILF